MSMKRRLEGLHSSLGIPAQHQSMCTHAQRTKSHPRQNQNGWPRLKQNCSASFVKLNQIKRCYTSGGATESARQCHPRTAVNQEASALSDLVFAEPNTGLPDVR